VETIQTPMSRFKIYAHVSVIGADGIQNEFSIITHIKGISDMKLAINLRIHFLLLRNRSKKVKSMHKNT